MLNKDGKEIKVGDTALLPVRIVEQYGEADFTDVAVESVHTHPPHDGIDRFHMSSAQLIGGSPETNPAVGAVQKELEGLRAQNKTLIAQIGAANDMNAQICGEKDAALEQLKAANDALAALQATADAVSQAQSTVANTEQQAEPAGTRKKK